MDTKQAFWNWFKENNQPYIFIQEMEEEERNNKMRAFSEQLKKYNENLTFLIGKNRVDDDHELIISAEGIREHFPAVEELVAAAPEIEGWQVLAFKPPMGAGMVVSIGGREFDPAKTKILTLQNKEMPKGVGINVCYDDFEEDKKQLFIQGTYIMLDSILGEKSTTMDIDYMDILKTPPGVDPTRFITFLELPQYIKTTKGR